MLFFGSSRTSSTWAVAQFSQLSATFSGVLRSTTHAGGVVRPSTPLAPPKVPSSLPHASAKPAAIYPRCIPVLVQALEDHMHRQAMMTARLVDERNSILGIAAPYEPEGFHMHKHQANAQVASHPKPETRARSLLPPPSRLAKTREAQGDSLPHSGTAGKTTYDAAHRKTSPAANAARRGGPEDDMALQQSEFNPPLKTWGSTGRRQPSRPRQKA